MMEQQAGDLRSMLPLQSLQRLKVEIFGLRIQVDKGFIDVAGVPTTQHTFKDSIDNYSRLLSQGARIAVIGEGGVGKSSLINHMVKGRMMQPSEYAQINIKTERDKIISEVVELIHKPSPLTATSVPSVSISDFVLPSEKAPGKYEFEEDVAECLYFLKRELEQFKKEQERANDDDRDDDDDDLDSEKENSKQRAFAIIGKRPGTSLNELCFEDIAIPPSVRDRLGRRFIYTDTSGDFAAGLAFARSILHSVTSNPHWGIAKHIILRVPSSFLRSGVRIVDAPSLDDADLMRMRHMDAWVKECTAVILVLSPPHIGHSIRSLLEKSGFMQSLQEDPSKQLGVVVPGDKYIKFMDKEKREEWETRHKKEKVDNLRKSLIKCSRAQEKRNAANAFLENSGRFKFCHFYRCWHQDGQLSLADSRMDQVEDIFEGIYAKHMQDITSACVSLIVEEVVDIASNNIESAVYWDDLRTHSDFESFCDTAQQVADKKLHLYKSACPQILSGLENLKHLWAKSLKDAIKFDVDMCTVSECEKRINEAVFANKSSDRMVMGALARQGKHQTNTLEQLMVGPLFDHMFNHIKNSCSLFTLDDPNASVLNTLWSNFYNEIMSDMTDDNSQGYQAVKLCVEESLAVLKTQIRHKLNLKDMFTAIRVDQTLQAVVHAQLVSRFDSQLAIFNNCNPKERKAFLLQNCAPLAEVSAASMVEVLAPVFGHAVDHASRLITQFAQQLVDMKSLFDSKRGSKLDKYYLRILKQRQLCMAQMKLNMINSVPWKDFENIRQKVVQTITQLGSDSNNDSSVEGDAIESWPPKETDILFAEINNLWLEKAEEEKLTWKWVELQATKGSLADRIVNSLRSTFVGNTKTKDDVLKFIRGRRLTYGDLPEDYQDAKEDIYLLHSGDSSDLLAGLRRKEKTLSRRKFILSKTYNHNSRRIGEILENCARSGGILVPHMPRAEYGDVKLVAVNPNAIQYLYESANDLPSLLSLKARPDVRFMSLTCLRDFLESGELDRSKEIFASGGVIIAQEGNAEIDNVLKAIASLENWHMKVLEQVDVVKGEPTSNSTTPRSHKHTVSKLQIETRDPPAQLQFKEDHRGCGCGCGQNGVVCTCGNSNEASQQTTTATDTSTSPPSTSAPTTPTPLTPTTVTTPTTPNGNSTLRTSDDNPVIVIPSSPRPFATSFTSFGLLGSDSEWLELGRLDDEGEDEYVVRSCVNISTMCPQLRNVVLLVSSQTSPTLIKKATDKKILCLNVPDLLQLLTTQPVKKVESALTPTFAGTSSSSPSQPQPQGGQKKRAAPKRPVGEPNAILYNGSCHCCRNRKPADQLVPCCRTQEFLNHKQKCRRVFCVQCLKTHYNLQVEKMDKETWVCPPCSHSCKCYQCVPLKRTTAPKKQKNSITFQPGLPMHQSNPQTSSPTPQNPNQNSSPTAQSQSQAQFHFQSQPQPQPQAQNPNHNQTQSHTYPQTQPQYPNQNQTQPHVPRTGPYTHTMQATQSPQQASQSPVRHQTQHSPHVPPPQVQQLQVSMNAHTPPSPHRPTHSPHANGATPQSPRTSNPNSSQPRQPHPQQLTSTAPVPHSPKQQPSPNPLSFSQSITAPSVRQSFSPYTVQPPPSPSAQSPQVTTPTQPHPASSQAQFQALGTVTHPFYSQFSATQTQNGQFSYYSASPSASTADTSSPSHTTTHSYSYSPQQNRTPSPSPGEMLLLLQAASPLVTSSSLSTSSSIPAPSPLSSSSEVYSPRKRRTSSIDEDDDDGGTDGGSKRVKKNGVLHVSLMDLMEHGYLTAGEKVQFVFRSSRYEALITPDGKIQTGDKQFPTPTAWTNAMSGHSTSGWGLIRIAATGEKLLTLKDKLLGQLGERIKKD